MSILHIILGILLKIKYNLKYLLYNSKYLFCYLILLTIKIFPFKVILIYTYGSIFGLLLFLFSIYQWGKILVFLRVIYYRAWLLLPLYYIKTSIYRIWILFFYEDKNKFQKYINAKDIQLVMRELFAGKGVIIIGSHCFVRIYGLILYENKIQLKILAVNDYNKNNPMLISCLETKRNRYIKNHFCFVKANYAEKDLVRHVINGGAALIYIDFPLKKGKSYAINFFGFPVKFSAFPFKMALRYNIPLFFSFVSGRKDGSYRLSVIPSGKFSTAEEGLSKYIQILQAHIRENPFMWMSGKNFWKWIDKSNIL